MKVISFVICSLLLSMTCGAQKPTKEQLEADKKRMAEAMKKLDEQTSKMDPAAKKKYDSLLNSLGVQQVKSNAISQVNSNTQMPPVKSQVGLMPKKDPKKIAAIAVTPATGSMGGFIGVTQDKTMSAVKPAAKAKGLEIFNGLKEKGIKAADAGKAAVLLWAQGRTEIALALMAKICADDPSNTDNLNNYASMLLMTGAPELAIPILNNLNSRFSRNSTLLNNLGQAWFALGETAKAEKYLDSALLFFAAHPQANLTKSIIEESKGNKTAAVANAKTSFKQAYSAEKADRLKKLGYATGEADYNYPSAKKSDDLLNLGGFTMPAFPTSVAECIALEPIWKDFRSQINKRLDQLKKITDESNRIMTQRLQQQQQQFMDAMNKTLAKPGSVSAATANGIVGAPPFTDKVGIKQKPVLENLARKKAAVVQKIAAFINGEGAQLKKKYEDAKKAVDQKIKDEEKKSLSGTVDPGEFCPDYVKASDAFLNPVNTKLEGLYNEYLSVEKQYLNEMAYTLLYTTYPELLPGAIAGLQMQWLRDLSLTMNDFNFVSVTRYNCTDQVDGKQGVLTEFKDPHCDIHSELKTMISSIMVDCSGITSQLNVGVIGVELKQDLDNDLFGDGFKSCTISIGPKFEGKIGAGPVEIGAEGKAGVDIEIDRNGIKDVVVKAGAEANAGLGGPVNVSGGMEGSVSINSGVGSLSGTGIFK